VHRLLPIRRLLQASSDPDNPPAEELQELFHEIRTIAVVGISRDPLKTARRVPSYLAAKGYDVIPVNPLMERALGRDAAATLEDVREPVDMVLIFRPTATAGPFVDEAAARRERPAIWLQEDIHAKAEISAARGAGFTAVQDLCSYRVHRELQVIEGTPLGPPRIIRR